MQDWEEPGPPAQVTDRGLPCLFWWPPTLLLGMTESDAPAPCSSSVLGEARLFRASPEYSSFSDPRKYLLMLGCSGTL